METTGFNFEAGPHVCHCVVNGGSKLAKTIVVKTFTPSFAASDTVSLILHPHRTLDVYWPVGKMQVVNSESMNCK